MADFVLYYKTSENNQAVTRDEGILYMCASATILLYYDTTILLYSYTRGNNQAVTRDEGILYMCASTTILL